MEAASTEESESIPLNGGVDQFRDEEDGDTPLPILYSGSHGVTVTEDDISKLHCKGVVVEYDNESAPENF